MSSESTSNRSTGTDWGRLRAQRDEDIDFSDIPELDEAAFRRAVMRTDADASVRKAQVTLRIDADVLAWFKAQGRGYQTRINRLLRAYVDEHSRSGR